MRKRIFRLSAQGCSPELASEILDDSLDHDGEGDIIESQAEKLFEEYLMLPVWKKLRLTLMVDAVSSRLHRLADDMLGRMDEKKAISLLDLKRKIKERMAREYTLNETRPDTVAGGDDSEIARLYEKVFGCSPPAE